MTPSITLLRCQTLQELDCYLSTLPKAAIGPWGGRKFWKGHDTFALNQLVSKLIHLSKREPNASVITKKLIGKVRAMDKLETPKVSLLQRVLTAVRRFFGNYFFDRNALLAELEKQLPQTTSLLQRPLTKRSAPPPVIRPSKPPVNAESKLLKGWLSNQAQRGTATLRLFKDIAHVRTSPYTPNNSVEGLLLQCTPDKKVDLQEENSLLLLQAIFKFCLITQLRSDYAGKQEDLIDWLTTQPTLGAVTVDAAIQGYISRESLEIAALLRIVSLTKQMKENPESLGAALAKAVELHANNNELERLVEWFIKNERISQEDYVLILDQFSIKRGQEGKAGMTWRILDLLQEYAQTQGWRTDGHPAPVE